MALTTRFGLTIPTVGANEDDWGTVLNAYFDSLESRVFNRLTGDTVTGPLTVTGATSLQGLTATATSVTTLMMTGALTGVTSITMNGALSGATTINASGVVTGASFTGAGTGLTGTAAALSIGGNAATATTSTNLSGGTVNATTGTFSGAVTAPSFLGNATTATTATNLSGGSVAATAGTFSGNVTLGDAAGDTVTVNGTSTFVNDVFVPTRPFGESSARAASVDFVNAAMFSAVLPAQTGNAGKFLTTDGTNASFAAVGEYRGEYSGMATYFANQSVSYLGNDYKALINNPVGVPTDDGVNWAQIGAPNPTGNEGKFLASNALGEFEYIESNLFTRRYVTQVDDTFVIPEGVSQIRAYCGGKGGNGSNSGGQNNAGGGGGGFAFGTINVKPGQSAVITTTAGVCKLTINSVDFLVANPGGDGVASVAGVGVAGGAGGTASIDPSVIDGGAFTGGTGGTSAVSGEGGGGSSGSPLGNGFGGGVGNNATPGGGGGIGGVGGNGSGTSGGNGGGGGAGEAGANGSGANPGYGGGSGVLPFGGYTDPLLKNVFGVRIAASDVSPVSIPGSGSNGLNGNVISGSFGGGGGGTSATGKQGGELGGGGGGNTTGGSSLACGGGGAGGVTAGTGGPATCWIYY